MWLLSVLSGLTLSCCCLAGLQQGVNEEGEASSNCGISGLTVTSEGEPISDIPWMITVYTKIDEPVSESDEIEMRQICGGSLIHYKAVLTSASCLHGISVENLEVRARVEVREDENQKDFHQAKGVATVVTHPMYIPITYANDLAILVLRDAFRPSANVIPVCLPDKNQQFVGSECVATGWGKNNFRHIKAPIESRESCTKALSNFFRLPISLHESLICTGLAINELRGMCTGDEGGPLACPFVNDSSRFVQIGVVTKKTFCGDTVSVYSDVQRVRGWIDDTFKANDIK